MEIIRIGVIGCGARLKTVIKDLVAEKGVQVSGVWDPTPENAQNLLRIAGNPDGTLYDSYESLVKDPSLDWVMVGSPNVFHKEQIIAAFEQGKNVFSEKPLATSIDDCVAINAAHKKSGKQFATGFVLRYSPLYRKVKEIFDSGQLGEIISVDANENIPPQHGAFMAASWRRCRGVAGPHILEKCVHDLDLFNWFTESVPLRIAAFGGNNYFVPEHAAQFDTHRETYTAWFEDGVEHIDANPFSCDKTSEDNVVCILEYATGVRVQFQATMANPIPERRMYFHCTRGNLIVDLYSMSVVVQTIDDDSTSRYEYPQGPGHGGGDVIIAQELAAAMISGGVPKCGGTEGLYSTVVALAVDEARLQGKIIDMTPLWMKLGVVVPDSGAPYGVTVNSSVNEADSTIRC